MEIVDIQEQKNYRNGHKSHDKLEHLQRHASHHLSCVRHSVSLQTQPQLHPLTVGKSTPASDFEQEEKYCLSLKGQGVNPKLEVLLLQ